MSSVCAFDGGVGFRIVGASPRGPMSYLINSPASWRLVGGIVYLYVKDRLQTYISRREGKGGILEGHLACGWMFTMGYQTYESQSGLIIASREQVEYLNKKYDATFVVPEPEMHGSAAPFMINPNLSY